jgi:hypothetical protein
MGFQRRCRNSRHKGRGRQDAVLRAVGSDLPILQTNQAAASQETAGRVAATYQQAPRWHAHRKNSLQMYERASRLEKNGRQAAAKRLRHKAEQLWNYIPQVPQALEQEAWRLSLQSGKPIDECFIELRDSCKNYCRPGPTENHAIRELIHRVQACASHWSPELSRGDTIRFLETVLETAAIYTSLVDNRSKLLGLMIASS